MTILVKWNKLLPVNENAILAAVINQLDNDLHNPESSLSTSIAKHQHAGLFILNITIQQNGEVVSIFAQSDEQTNISIQNMLKDIIPGYRFDVTVPKNERLKFTYTFILKPNKSNAYEKENPHTKPVFDSYSIRICTKNRRDENRLGNQIEL